MENKSESPICVGNNVFVRTVTHYTVGKIIKIDKDEIVLSNASWVADTGRWHNALKTGELTEVEPFIDAVSISRGAIVDVTNWRHELPVHVK
jgi:hypothetical protein